MAQRAARIESSPPSRADHSTTGTPEGLGRDWAVIRTCRLRPSDRGSSPTILIHPERGIAVLDVLPSATPDAVEAVRAKLHLARFAGIFAGHLPVVHLQAAPRQTPSLPAMLEEAFAALPPLSLPGGDAWTGVATRALLAEQHSPRLEPQPRAGSVEEGSRRRRRRGRVLRAAGAVFLSLSALGGVLALALKEAPGPAVSVVAPAPTPPVAVVVPPPPPPESVVPREALGIPALPAAPAPIPPPPPPSRTVGGTAAPVPEQPSPAAPPASQRSATPQAPSPRRSETPAPPNRKPSERTAPQQRRHQQQDAGAAEPLSAGAAPLPEAVAQRCRRVAGGIGSGAPLGEADMRFFNDSCIRW